MLYSFNTTSDQEPGLLIQSGPGQVHHVYTVALVELTADYKANITRPSKSDLEIGRKALGECSRRKEGRIWQEKGGGSRN